MRSARRLAPLAVVLALAGCSDGDDPNRLTRMEPPTPEESAMGADGEDPATPGAEDDLGPVVLDTPVEDSTPYLDPASDPASDPAPSGTATDPPKTDPPKTDPAKTSAPKDPVKPPPTCQRATGYRSGKPFTICVTMIDSKPVEVNTARAYLKMRADAKARGVSLHIVSGFRTMAQQQYLYNCYLTKKCNNGNLAARPGYSNHQSGHALDLNTSTGGVYTYLSHHGSAFRFRRTVPSEIWHWEYW